MRGSSAVVFTFAHQARERARIRFQYKPPRQAAAHAHTTRTIDRTALGASGLARARGTAANARPLRHHPSARARVREAIVPGAPPDAIELHAKYGRKTRRVHDFRVRFDRLGTPPGQSPRSPRSVSAILRAESCTRCDFLPLPHPTPLKANRRRIQRRRPQAACRLHAIARTKRGPRAGGALLYANVADHTEEPTPLPPRRRRRRPLPPPCSSGRSRASRETRPNPAGRRAPRCCAGRSAAAAPRQACPRPRC